LRPFFSYYGGKWRAAPRYPSPTHKVLVEPFAGAAGYALRHPHLKVILVDKNPKVVSTWRYLIGVSERELRYLPDLPVGATTGDLKVCDEAKLLIGWWLNKGTAAPRKSPSSNMRKSLSGENPKDPPSGWWGAAIRERLATQVEYIRHWEVLEGDYTCAPDVGATWFVDPPYISAGKYYAAKYNSKGLDYERLGQWCRTRKGQVLVCENDGADWLPFRTFGTFKANEGRSGGKRTVEVLWESPQREGVKTC